MPDIDREQRLIALNDLTRALFDAEQLRRFLGELRGGRSTSCRAARPPTPA